MDLKNEIPPGTDRLARGNLSPCTLRERSPRQLEASRLACGDGFVEASESSRDRIKRLVIIDNHTLVRRGLFSIIEDQPDLEVCAEASSSQEGLEKVCGCQPDLVTVELSLREGDGLELIKGLLALLPAMPVLVISMHDETIYAERS